MAFRGFCIWTLHIYIYAYADFRDRFIIESIWLAKNVCSTWIIYNWSVEQADKDYKPQNSFILFQKAFIDSKKM